MSHPSDDPHLDPFVAQVYDAEHTGDAPDVEWVLRLAAQAGGPVIDLGCGTGRLTLPLAAAGNAVEALDHSPAMLAQLRRKLARQPSEVRRRVRVREADLAEVGSAMGQAGAGLTLFGYNTFGALLDARTQQACLAQLHASLRPGGRIAVITAALSAAALSLLDGATREVYRRPAPELGQGVILARRDVHRWTDETNQIRHLALIYDVFEPDGGRRQHQLEYAVRYTGRWELEHLLARCGFRTVEAYGGYEEEPFAVGNALLVVTAER